MLDPTTPDPSGKAAMLDLTRRVEALERANQLLVSTITGGTLTVLNSAGLPVARIGHYDSTYSLTTDGLSVTAPGMNAEVQTALPSAVIPLEGLTMLEVNDTDGVVFPGPVVPWRQEWASMAAPIAQHTVPSDWYSYYTAYMPITYSRGFRFTTYFQGSAATTWEFRVGFTTGAVVDNLAFSNTFTVPDATGYSRQLVWNPSPSIPGLGANVVFLQCRRTAGAGGATVFAPHAMWWAYGMPDGEGGGTWRDLGTF